MRIGYYIPAWPPGSVPNGIVTTLGHLGGVLRELGHEVFYITPHAAQSFADERVLVLNDSSNHSILDTIRYKWNPEKTLYVRHSEAIAAAVNLLIAKYGIDIFQMEETHGWASKVIQQVSIPVVVRLHGPWHLTRELGSKHQDNAENRHRVAREGKSIFEAAAIAGPSESVLSLTEQFYGKIPSLKQVIQNPIDTLPLAKRWKLDACDRNVVLFVGRFDRIKGADLVLKAFAIAARERPHLRLIFVGPDVGLTNEQGLPMNFEEFVEKEIPSYARPRIHFYGTLTRPEIEDLRKKAFLTVVTSRYETFGNVVIEAMAFGCPIVATGVGGILEIIKDKQNGLMAPLSASGIASTVTKLLDNPELAATLGSQAAQDCYEQFDPTKIGHRTINFYSTVIDSWVKKLVD
jgi:glycosyltransferase involved in cell wall biosynthesis